MNEIPSLQALCLHRLTKQSWGDLSFLRGDESHKVLSIYQSTLPDERYFWRNIADWAKPEELPAIRASGIATHKIPEYSYTTAVTSTIGGSILYRAVREDQLELAEGILPCLSDNQIEEVAESQIYRNITPTQILSISSMKDKKRIRQLLLSKQATYRSYAPIIAEHFSSLFTKEEIELIEKNRLGRFGAEIICYRLRHSLHDSWTKKFLSQSKCVPPEDGKLFLDQLLTLPPSHRRTEMAAYVFAASKCEHEALKNKDFFIAPSQSEALHLHIPQYIDLKLKQASKSKDVQFIKTFFSNFPAIIGNVNGAKRWYQVLLRP